ncbi:MAG: glycosyltransferase family 2 protein [Proteobacteria bacterium]|nr:glycosyltransferase family 2 protein [Pseudomonadota bacterium]
MPKVEHEPEIKLDVVPDIFHTISPKVVIIILNWNGKDDTIECLESLKHITYPNYEILLVDNGSTDGSINLIMEKFAKINMLESKKNLGFAEGNNEGIINARKIGFDYILLLNNDTIVDPSFLTEMVKIGESDDKTGIIGAVNYYYNEPERVWFCGGKFNFWNGKAYRVGVTKDDKVRQDKIDEADYVAGSCFLIKKIVMDKIGVLDKEYFAYWEEADYCVRSQKAGFRVLYVPKAKIWHKVSSTSKKINGFYEYYNTRSNFLFMKKHATRIQFASFLLWFFFIDFWSKTFIFFILYKNVTALSSFYKGIKDGILV